MTPLEIAKHAGKILDEKNGTDIKILKVEDLTILADYFVIASGDNKILVKALSDEVDNRMAKMGITPKKIEGESSGNWILLDYGDVIVHIFHKEARDFYSLDRLWADAKLVEVSE
ncbi:MAG: ribosome silencing factor [Ruminococcaceae bacterium]|nr:ribosome silencing factor [Oscillospiraceae bacterium]